MAKSRVWKDKKEYSYYCKRHGKRINVKKHGQHYYVKSSNRWKRINLTKYELYDVPTAKKYGWLEDWREDVTDGIITWGGSAFTNTIYEMLISRGATVEDVDHVFDDLEREGKIFFTLLPKGTEADKDDLKFLPDYRMIHKTMGITNDKEFSYKKDEYFTLLTNDSKTEREKKDMYELEQELVWYNYVRKKYPFVDKCFAKNKYWFRVSYGNHWKAVETYTESDPVFGYLFREQWVECESIYKENAKKLLTPGRRIILQFGNPDEIGSYYYTVGKVINYAGKKVNMTFDNFEGSVVLPLDACFKTIKRGELNE